MKVEINIEEIQEFLPHRYPMLLVDRVTELVLGESIKAYKNITTNEPFFTGHFPGKQVMPGVLIVESMAQASGILGFKTMDKKPEDGSIRLLFYRLVFSIDLHLKMQQLTVLSLRKMVKKCLSALKTIRLQKC